MIDPVSAYAATAPFYTRRSTAAPPGEAAAPASGGGADRVSISAEGQRLAAAGKQTTERMANPFAARPDGSLPPLITDYGQLVEIAETRLKELMGDLGIDPATPVTITDDGSGNLTVDIDHPKAKELEELANHDQILRNGVIGAATMARVSRIAAAQRMASDGIDANPEKSDRYIDWLMRMSRQAAAMDVRFSLSGGRLSGTLLAADGRPVGTAEGLSLPG